MFVTDHFKTSQSGSNQNQPLWGALFISGFLMQARGFWDHGLGPPFASRFRNINKRRLDKKWKRHNKNATNPGNMPQPRLSFKAKRIASIPPHNPITTDVAHRIPSPECCFRCQPPEANHRRQPAYDPPTATADTRQWNQAEEKRGNSFIQSRWAIRVKTERCP